MTKTARVYWDDRYGDTAGINHHVLQNLQLTRDLMERIKTEPVIEEAFRSAHTVLEVGCGTGDLSAHINRVYAPRTLYATDFSRTAVATAQKRYPQINFWTWDVLKDTFNREFDLGISSNCVEHFSDPHIFIGRMLGYCKQVLIVAPYKQKDLDGYDEEGGAGHAVSLSKSSFTGRYNVRSTVIFESKGWQHSTGEKPRQIAVLLKAKKC